VQIHATTRFEKYLGFNMFYGQVRKQDFSAVYDRVNAKLASWKSSLLNKPGRVVLANSVLSSLPSYHMQINWLPQSVCDDLDKSVRRFIWKGTGDTGMHMVNWKKITQPRKFGGLGVRCARSQNVALLGKLIWEILQSPDKLWVSLFRDRYLQGKLPFNTTVTGGSVIWNAVAKALHILKDGFTLKIGDGESSFWYESWVVKERLCTMVPFVAIQHTTLKINDVWHNGNWNLQILYTQLPTEVVNAITAIKPRIVQNLPDVWVWKNSSTGVYSVKDAYTWLSNPAPINEHVNWNWIWQLHLSANIQFFVWQLIHGAVPVRAVLHHRQISNTDICPRCTSAPETIEHCLFQCTSSARIWQACGIHILHMASQGIDNFTWYKTLGKKHGSVFFVILWVVWCMRNKVVFENYIESTHDSVAKILATLKSCDAAFSSPNRTVNPVIPRLVTWSRPAIGTMCLNVDGSLLGATDSAGYGGLLRNNNGEFILGFYGAAATPSILFAELMAVLKGLQLCWENGYRRIVCCSDSLQTVNLIRDGVSVHHRFANKVFSIRQLIDKDWNVVVEHTLRDGNTCADVLAKMGAQSNVPLVSFHTPPMELASPLLADAQGVAFVRE
jgi:ribonuclease HI